ncbi:MULTISPECIES: hypothetical protein [unclassified Oleiphilus]|nr:MULTISPECIES: hypothetical protein [unclassified Oleiphilus]
MSSKSMIMLSEGSHRLDYLETQKLIQVSDKERIAKLLSTGYRSTASVATRSKNKAACFKQINLDKEFWAINCKLQATKNKKPKNTLATVLPKASNYRSIPKQVLVGEFASSHYIASENFCKTIDEHAIELAEKALTSGKAILILSPKGYDWEENTILPISNSCKQSLDQELAELNTLDLNKSLHEQLIYHAYKTHGLIFDASETLQQKRVN